MYTTIQLKIRIQTNILVSVPHTLVQYTTRTHAHIHFCPNYLLRCSVVILSLFLSRTLLQRYRRTRNEKKFELTNSNEINMKTKLKKKNTQYRRFGVCYSSLIFPPFVIPRLIFVCCICSENGYHHTAATTTKHLILRIIRNKF